MTQEIDKRIGEGIIHILVGLWSLFTAAVDLLLLLTGMLIEGTFIFLRNFVWPFLKEYGPKAARGAVNVSIVSVNYTTIALASVFNGVRSRT